MEKIEYGQGAINTLLVKFCGTTLEYIGLIISIDGVLRSHNLLEISGGFVAYLAGKGLFNHIADTRIIELNRDLILDKLTGLQGKIAETEKTEGVEAKIEH